jgi:hypothetical protein
MADTKTRKPGPKPYSAQKRRSRLIGIPVNAAEYAAIRKASGKWTVAAWARGVLLAAARYGA